MNHIIRIRVGKVDELSGNKLSHHNRSLVANMVFRSPKSLTDLFRWVLQVM